MLSFAPCEAQVRKSESRHKQPCARRLQKANAARSGREREKPKAAKSGRMREACERRTPDKGTMSERTAEGERCESDRQKRESEALTAATAGGRTGLSARDCSRLHTSMVESWHFSTYANLGGTPRGKTLQSSQISYTQP